LHTAFASKAQRNGIVNAKETTDKIKAIDFAALVFKKARINALINGNKISKNKLSIDYTKIKDSTIHR